MANDYESRLTSAEDEYWRKKRKEVEKEREEREYKERGLEKPKKRKRKPRKSKSKRASLVKGLVGSGFKATRVIGGKESRATFFSRRSRRTR